MSEIGKLIKKRREELGITQEELASRLGYKSKTTIAKIESGINDIAQSKVVDFAKALETTPAYLMNINDSLRDSSSNYLDFICDSSIAFEITGRSLQHSPDIYNTLLSCVKDIVENDSTLCSKKGENNYKTIYEHLKSLDTSYEEKANLLNVFIDFVICDPDTKRLQVFINTDSSTESPQYKKLSQLFTNLNSTGINRVLEYATALSSLSSYKKDSCSSKTIAKCSLNVQSFAAKEQPSKHDTDITNNNKESKNK